MGKEITVKRPANNEKILLPESIPISSIGPVIQAIKIFILKVQYHVVHDISIFNRRA